MAIIKIYQGKSKPANKKPGWRDTLAQEAAWLQSVNSQRLFSSKPAPVKSKAPRKPLLAMPAIDPSRINKVNSLDTWAGACTKPVARPEIRYRDDPEMLERELKARERKFATAPAYNKGPAQFLSEDMDADMRQGLLRRR